MIWRSNVGKFRTVNHGLTMAERQGSAVRLVWVFWVFYLFLSEPARSVEDVDEARCGRVVEEWSAEQLRILSTKSSYSAPLDSPNDRLQSQNFSFFLHVPRTGGRNFVQCFLNSLYEFQDRCPPSYDFQRFNVSHPQCRLLASHDDYSLLNQLPEKAISVSTTIRDPVHRLLSAYEFSMIHAARAILTSNWRAPSTPHSVLNSEGIDPSSPATRQVWLQSTLRIWPWKYLVPLLGDDILERRKLRLGLESAAGVSGVLMNATIEVSGNTDSYDAAAFTLPLRDFIRHPLVHDLLHNGATLQVAGLTNASILEEAQEIRVCILKFPLLGQQVLKVAKGRLDKMLYVGLTDSQRATARYFLTVLGRQLSLEHIYRRVTEVGPQSQGIPVQGFLPEDGKETFLDLNNGTSFDELTREQLIEEVLHSYDFCTKRLRAAQWKLGKIACKLIPPFSNKMRSLIAADTIEVIRKLNSLDVDLFEHAKFIFEKQQRLPERLSVEKEVEKEVENCTLIMSTARFWSGEDVNCRTSIETVFCMFPTAFATATMSMCVFTTGIVTFLLWKRSSGLRMKET